MEISTEFCQVNVAGTPTVTNGPSQKLSTPGRVVKYNATAQNMTGSSESFGQITPSPHGVARRPLTGPGQLPAAPELRH